MAAEHPEVSSTGRFRLGAIVSFLIMAALAVTTTGGRAASVESSSVSVQAPGGSTADEVSSQGTRPDGADVAPVGSDGRPAGAAEQLLSDEPLVVRARLAGLGPRRDPADGPVRERLVVSGVGDVNVDPGYIPAFVAEGYEHALSGLGGLFLEDDLTIINLECPATTIGRAVPKQFTFQCDPEALAVLRADGVEVANQGNNHSLDFGVDAMLDSLVNLADAGIAAVGTGSNAAEAHRPALFELKGWTVAVIGFGGVVPAASWIAGEDSPGMADGDTIETMVAAVRAADEVADLVVVTIHWGKELQSGPPPDDVARAQAMIEAGADMIFGHHAHRLNALELVDDRPVAWSLGNFVWPRLSAAGSDTAVAQVVVDPDGTITACFLDVTIVSDGHPELDDPNNRSCVQ